MFVIPTAIMFYCHIKIWCVAQRQKRRMNSLSLGTFKSSKELIANNGEDESHNDSNAIELRPMTLVVTENGKSQICSSESDSDKTILEKRSSPARHLNKATKVRQPHKHNHLPEDVRAAWSIALLCLFFLAMWGPYWLSVLMLPFIGYHNMNKAFLATALWLNFLGTAINPFIYYFSNSAVRAGVIRVFKKVVDHVPKSILTIFPCVSRWSDPCLREDVLRFIIILGTQIL